MPPTPGSSNQDSSEPESSDAAASNPEEQNRLPTCPSFPEEMRTSIENESDLLERHAKLEEEVHQRSSTRDSSPDRKQIYIQDLTRVFSYIEQVQRLAHRINLAQTCVTPHYYQKHLKRIAIRADERLRTLGARKEAVEIELANIASPSARKRGSSGEGPPGDFELMRQVGEAMQGGEARQQQRDDRLTDAFWKGGMPQPTGNRSEESGKSYWVTEKQFHELMTGKRFESSWEQQATKAVALSELFKEQVTKLEQEIAGLKAENYGPGAQDPQLLAEIVTVLMHRFLLSCSGEYGTGSISKEQMAIMKRLKTLVPKFYPEHDLESLAETGQYYIACLTPSPSPEPPETRAKSISFEKSAMKQDRVNSALDNLDVAASPLTKKEGKRAIRDSDRVQSGSFEGNPPCALLSSPIATAGFPEANTQIGMKNGVFTLGGEEPKQEAEKSDANGSTHEAEKSGTNGSGQRPPNAAQYANAAQESMEQGNGGERNYWNVIGEEEVSRRPGSSPESRKRSADEMDGKSGAQMEEGSKRSKSESPAPRTRIALVRRPGVKQETR